MVRPDRLSEDLASHGHVGKTQADRRVTGRAAHFISDRRRTRGNRFLQPTGNIPVRSRDDAVRTDDDFVGAGRDRSCGQRQRVGHSQIG